MKKNLVRIGLLLGLIQLWMNLSAINKYWVGGNGNWDPTNTANWSLTSGGSGGAPVPTFADNVFFDINSGTASVGLNATCQCYNIDCTGFTGDLFGNQSLHVKGNFKLGSGMSFTFSGAIGFLGTSGTFTVTTNGIVINAQIVFNGINGIWILTDNLSCTGVDLELLNGTLNANNFNITVKNFYSSTVGSRTLIMGSGIWTLTGIGCVWDLSNSTNLNFNSNTSTIKITNNTASEKTTFQGGGLVYHNLWIANNSTLANVIYGSNIFNEFKADPGTILEFDAFQTQIVSLLTITGTASEHIKLNGVNGNQWTISVPNGLVCCDYLDLYNSVATGGATFYAGANSYDGGSNSGWIFSSCTTDIFDKGTDNLFKVYPNPTSGHFSIFLTDLPAEIIITDMIGRQIKKSQTYKNQLDFQLSNDGLYFIFIITNNGFRTEELIVNSCSSSQ